MNKETGTMRTLRRGSRVFNDKRTALLTAEKRFRRSCEQIILLNQTLGNLQNRYDRAKKANFRSFRYNLRLRLAVVEGLRNVYYDYAHEKAKQVAQLRQELFGEIVEIVAEEENDEDDETEEMEFAPE